MCPSGPGLGGGGRADPGGWAAPAAYHRGHPSPAPERSRRGNHPFLLRRRGRLHPKDFPPDAFGDIGPSLGRAIRESKLCRPGYRLGTQTIRATVIGAGCHTTALSGSTVFCRDVALPLQNLRAVCLSPREQAALPAHLPEKLRAAEGQAIVALPGLPAPGYAQICALAEALLEAVPQGPVLVCLEEDQAKALGQAMACRTERPILCIDRVRPPRDGFLDIGPPAGAAYPLVVKTLVFGKEQQL